MKTDRSSEKMMSRAQKPLVRGKNNPKFDLQFWYILCFEKIRISAALKKVKRKSIRCQNKNIAVEYRKQLKELCNLITNITKKQKL